MTNRSNLARAVGPRCALALSLALATALSGCGTGLDKYFSSDDPVLPNRDAVDRALKLCSLTDGDRPFHLILTIPSPPGSGTRVGVGGRFHDPAQDSGKTHAADEARVEIYWLNRLTYRTEVRSADFTQTRIVNAGVVEEHNTGAYYPRWLENFVDAVLEPIPLASRLREVPGSVGVGLTEHACISSIRPNPNSTDTDSTPGEDWGQIGAARICFQDTDPKIASGRNALRNVAFGEFAPFGNQQIARTLVNILSANTQLHGRVTLLETMPDRANSLVKAHIFTPADQQISTMPLPASTLRAMLAQAALNSGPATAPEHSRPAAFKQVSLSTTPRPAAVDLPAGQYGTIFIRTDRTGQVREAYGDSSDIYGFQKEAIAHALRLKFKPLVIHGVARQMEGPLDLAAFPTLAPDLAPRPAR